MTETKNTGSLTIEEDDCDPDMECWKCGGEGWVEGKDPCWDEGELVTCYSCLGSGLRKDMTTIAEHDEEKHGYKALSQTGLVDGCPRCEMLKEGKIAMTRDELRFYHAAWTAVLGK
jgi:hypothetical protein